MNDWVQGGLIKYGKSTKREVGMENINKDEMMQN
jgi:hypothetical protein